METLFEQVKTELERHSKCTVYAPNHKDAMALKDYFDAHLAPYDTVLVTPHHSPTKIIELLESCADIVIASPALILGGIRMRDYQAIFFYGDEMLPNVKAQLISKHFVPGSPFPTVY
ncbi:hypothetical protein ACXWTF_12890 [Thiomicrolovo sp. ZZH C-3]